MSGRQESSRPLTAIPLSLDTRFIMQLSVAAIVLVLAYPAALVVAQNDVAVIGTLPPPTTTTANDVSAAAASGTPARSPATITITVNRVANKFAPENITAEVGDIIKYEFWPSNSSVARSEYLYPCIPYALTGASKASLGFYTGFKPIVANLAQVNISELVSAPSLPSPHRTTNAPPSLPPARLLHDHQPHHSHLLLQLRPRRLHRPPNGRRHQPRPSPPPPPPSKN